MRTLITLTFLCLLATFSAGAQSPYTLTALNEPYMPLSGATSANGSSVWSTQFFTMPLGFGSKLGKTAVTRVFTDGAVIYADTAGTSVDLFQTFFASTVDRGLGTATSKTPLRYVTTGAAPNRIFKFEGTGIGFAKEQQLYSTFADSFDYQFWLYEGTNVAELRFGPSKVSHSADYFPGGQPSFTGYFNVSFATGEGNIGYFAAGTATAPYTDSFTATHMPGLLSAYPPSGTVYRFTPKAATMVAGIAAQLDASVYPTISTGRLTISYNEAAVATYRLMSITGAEVANGMLQRGVNTIDVSSLAAGQYVLQVQTADKRVVCRFGKQ